MMAGIIHQRQAGEFPGLLILNKSTPIQVCPQRKKPD